MTNKNKNEEWKEEFDRIMKDNTLVSAISSDSFNSDCEELRSFIKSQRASAVREFARKIKKFVRTEPGATIPRTVEHLEAYRRKMEIKNDFRKEIIEHIDVLSQIEE